MLEQKSDIWSARQRGDWVVIATCGVVTPDGKLVMGRGIAREASSEYPQLSTYLGWAVKSRGLQVEVIVEPNLIAFPTKNHFRHKSDINLILKSTIQLVDAVSNLTGRILLPRVGCGNGKLDWAEVEPMMRHYLTDDRFVVFSK